MPALHSALKTAKALPDRSYSVQGRKLGRKIRASQPVLRKSGQSETGENLMIRVLNASKRDIFKDLDKAVEFDQSVLFKKVYEEEYGTLGGHPYGMLVGDYEFDRTPEDIATLQKISNVAASAPMPPNDTGAVRP